MQYRKRKKDLGYESNESEYYSSYTADEQPPDTSAPQETREDTRGNREGANMRTTFVPNSYQRNQQPRQSETGAFSTYSNRYLQPPSSPPPPPRYTDNRNFDNRGNEARGNDRPYPPRENRSYDNRGGGDRPYPPRENRSYDNRGGGDRPYPPRENRGYDNRGGGDRPYPPRENRGYDNRGGGDRPYPPRENRSYDNRGGGDRPYPPRENRSYDNRGGGDRPYPPRENRSYDNRGGGDRPYPPRENRSYDNRGGGDRPYPPRENRGYDNRGGGDRPYPPRENRGHDNRGGGDRPYPPRENRGHEGRGGDRRNDGRSGDRRYESRGGDRGRSTAPRGDKRSFQVRSGGRGQQSSTARGKKKNDHIISLARALATLQFCSRNIAIEYIQNARVRVNGTMVNDPNTRFTMMQDRVMIDEMPLVKQRPTTYVLVHKTSKLSPSKETNVRSIHSVVPSSEQWYFPTGRLDKSMSGLVLMTNDPAHKSDIASPLARIEKEYWVKVQRTPKVKELKAAEKLLNTPVKGEATCKLHRENKRSAWIAVTVKTSTSTVIRKALKEQGLEVLAMHRYRIGSMTTDTLTPGSWKALNDYEIALVNMEENPTASFFFNSSHAPAEAVAEHLASVSVPTIADTAE